MSVTNKDVETAIQWLRSLAKSWPPQWGACQSHLDVIERALSKKDEAGIAGRIQGALDELTPPPRLTEGRKEYWKAGARAAIHAVNGALKASP